MGAKIDKTVTHAFIRKHNGILSNKKMAAALGVSEGHISQQRKAMGLETIPVRCKSPKSSDDVARDSMIKESLGGALSLGWLRKPLTAEGVGA